MSNEKNSSNSNKSHRGAYLRRITKDEIASTFLFEIAWEVCNQVGGIYTVVRSKIPEMVLN